MKSLSLPLISMVKILLSILFIFIKVYNTYLTQTLFISLNIHDNKCPYMSAGRAHTVRNTRQELYTNPGAWNPMS